MKKKKREKKIIEQATSRLNVADTAESTLQYLSLWPDSKGRDAGDVSPPQPFPVSPSMILLTLQMRSVMMRPIASQGLLGPLATVEATMGARERTMTAPSNTWENPCTRKHTHTHTRAYCYFCSFHSGMTLREWHCSEKGPRVSGLMGPMGAYLYFVLYVIPYPQHHDPKHRLRQTEGQRAGYTHMLRWKTTMAAKRGETGWCGQHTLGSRT